jgi:hypothetical protein
MSRRGVAIVFAWVISAIGLKPSGTYRFCLKLFLQKSEGAGRARSRSRKSLDVMKYRARGADLGAPK